MKEDIIYGYKKNILINYKLVIILLVGGFSLPLYVIFEKLIGASYNIINLLLVFWTVVMIGYSVCDVKKRGINLSNVFAGCFFGVLLMNNLNLSNLQAPKNVVDMYYFLTGPMIYWGILSFYERTRKIRIKKLKGLNADVIAVVMILGCLLLNGYIYCTKGIRFFSTSWRTKEQTEFVISGVSGLAYMFMWLTLMLIPTISKKKLKLVAVIIPGICIVLSAIRQNFIIMSFFLIFVWGVQYGRDLLSRQNIIKLTIIVAIIVILFGVWGNYRQQKIGWTNANLSIGRLLSSRTDNVIINWLYGYTGLNFDVLKQSIIEGEKTGEFKALLVPVMRIFGGSKSILSYEESLFTHGLNGFNASTFLSRYIKEQGVFYIIDIILLAFLVCFLDFLCYMVSFKGGRVLLLTMTALTCYGDYYLSIINLFFTLIIGIILHLFIQKNIGIISITN